MKHNPFLTLVVPVLFGLLSIGLLSGGVLLGGGGGDGDGVDILPYFPGNALIKGPPGGGGGRVQFRRDDGPEWRGPDGSSEPGTFLGAPRQGVVLFGFGPSGSSAVTLEGAGLPLVSALVSPLKALPYEGSLEDLARRALELALAGSLSDQDPRSRLMGRNLLIGFVSLEDGRPAMLTVISLEIGSGLAPFLWCVPL